MNSVFDESFLSVAKAAADEEMRYTLLYFLRDFGIKSAHVPAVTSWSHYGTLINKLKNKLDAF